MTDPTNLIDSYERAQILAHAMLRLAPDPAPQLWQSTSTPVLSALLYTASPGQGGAGIAWVNNTIAALATSDPDATHNWGIPTTPAGCLVTAQLGGLPELQRASIIETLRGAVAPWLAA